MDKSLLTIAGLDPSGGAGLLADVKTFHQFGMNGFGVCTAITYQNESECLGLQWMSLGNILDQLRPLSNYQVEAVKIGLVENLEVLQKLLAFVKSKFPTAQVVWDPVIKASAGYTFHDAWSRPLLVEVMAMVDVITPNQEEAEFLSKMLNVKSLERLDADVAVILKGGHADGILSEDVLLRKDNAPFYLQSERLAGKSIHGSGCVFSSALAAGLAKDQTLEGAFRQAKLYVFELLKQSNTALGQHHLL
ncbi:hydroxymethylpyrimidine/phosphomethylpyrimidine kinase [Fulvivirga ligni]|uniref:hydroxymethylpyrimidine/phosphomethylpyrimidine kinase n=1 Tax=Fulvivirga ligni TaxID=2904246 RepID=UPI001F3BE2B7|nr:hydroxymethylpyrimidine/phosphomethylpyrimidine kinase [Fulvivirga ligni]UII20579.1 hydroxymethylpyrimidine/phosphomethylpyrimidine kinase [Fulvivirga ligni]